LSNIVIPFDGLNSANDGALTESDKTVKRARGGSYLYRSLRWA